MTAWDYIGMFLTVQFAVLAAVTLTKGKPVGLVAAWGSVFHSFSIQFDDSSENWPVRKDERDRWIRQADEVVGNLAFFISAVVFWWALADELRVAIAFYWYAIFLRYAWEMRWMWRRNLGLWAGPVIALGATWLPLYYFSAPMDRVPWALGWYALVAVLLFWKKFSVVLWELGYAADEEAA